MLVAKAFYWIPPPAEPMVSFNSEIGAPQNFVLRRPYLTPVSYTHLAGVRGGFLREEGILFRMLPTPDYCGNGFGRVQNVGRFLWELSRRCGVLARDFSPDAVICASTHPFDFTAGKRIAQQSGAALVFELHDIWPLSLIELHGFSERHPLMRLIDRAESRAFEQSDGVVSLLPGLPRYLEERGLSLIHISSPRCLPGGIGASSSIWRFCSR